ncbi:hypothetical protein HDU96_004892 [Phlyctochytrium bullatum]|nr:hypothetical protein HDU96_004892 [Phlyctochytrium bullatum]
MRPWAMPTTTRDTTFTRSNFLGITAPVPLVVPAPVCNASWLQVAINDNNTIIGNCGVASWTLHCASAPLAGYWSKHVVDRNSTFGWRSIDLASRFSFVTDWGYPINDSYQVDTSYAFCTRTEQYASLMYTITAKRVRFDRSGFTPMPPFISTIFNGTSVALPNYVLPSSPAAPIVSDTAAIQIVMAVHAVLGVLMALGFFFVLYRLPRRRGEEEEEEEGMELPVVVSGTGDGEGEEDEEALPWYAKMATPPVLEEGQGVSKEEVVEEVLGQKENKAVMYI